MLVLIDHLTMIDRLHPATLKIIDKIFKDLEIKKISNTFDELAEACNTSQENLVRIFNKRRGKNPERFTLNMALKLWQGLGHLPETLVADCNVDPLLAVKIRRIQESDYRELFDLLVDVLKDYEYADPGQLAVIKGALEAVRATVLARKSQPPAGPGEKLLNSAEK